MLGYDPAQTPVSKFAQQVGVVFQNAEHQLFASTVWEEAIFAAVNFGMLDDSVEAHARQLLEQCGLSDRLDDHPYRLSYGQKRRLNLVSVLTYRPQLILLDEILIGQDVENAAFLMGLLADHVNGGGMVIMVNHNPDVTAHYANRLLFLEAGQIVVDAPVRQGFEQLAQRGKDVYVPLEAAS